MATTLEQARGIVRGVNPQQTTDNGGGDIFTPPTGSGGAPDLGPGPWAGQYGGGIPSAEGANMLPPGYEPVPGHDGYYYNPELDRIGLFRGNGYKADGSLSYEFHELTGGEDKAFRDSYAASAGGGVSSGGGGGGFDTGPGYLDLSRQKFAADEAQRAIDNANWLKQFGLEQTQANRGELGQRAGVGLSTGNLALDLALRNDRLANDPGNFPAWLQAMQANTAQGPVAQSLVGQGVTITPAPNDYLNDPRFKTLLDSLFNYGTVPDAGAVDRTQAAYNTDPAAANTFFSQDPANLKRMFGTPMATGGSFTTNGPMTFKDLSTGKNIATAGEAGKETITVTPQNSPNMAAQQQVSPSQGTAMALGKVLGAGGFSFFPQDVRQKFLRGELATPGELPDWVLAKLPPSIRQLIGALITSGLGSSGAQDFDWTRGLYEAKGFSGAGGVVR